MVVVSTGSEASGCRVEVELIERVDALELGELCIYKPLTCARRLSGAEAFMSAPRQF